ALEELATPEGGEIAQCGIRDGDHVAARAAVTAVGSALRDVLLAAEMDRAVTTAAGRDSNARPVVEHVALLDDCNCAAFAALAELDGALARREDRVVLADARAGARAELRAALADEDHSRLHGLSGEH